MAGNGTMWVILVLSLVAAVPCFATVYTVGDSSGWSLGTDYTTWAATKTFVVGDSLVFTYGSSHTVDEVTLSDYSTCTTGNAITTDNAGSTTILLKTAGVHNFICGTGGHCGSGMKLSVTVSSSSSTTPTTPTTPSTPSVITPPTSGGTTPPSIYSPPTTDGSGYGSGSGSVSSSVLVGFVAMLVGFMVFAC